MAIIERKETKPVIDLTGPQGNAFSILGHASSLASKLGFTKEENQKIQDDMMSSDYEHLIQVFDSHFGDYVDLAR